MISELVKSDKQKRMMKKLLIFIICICGAMASMQAQNMGNLAARKLQMAEFAIANLYVDSVDENKLVEEAIIRMLAQLDPHALGLIFFAQKADNVARQRRIKAADTGCFGCCKRRDRCDNILRDPDGALVAFGRPIFFMIRHSAHSPL